jgi:ribA/ribD-fused uncharacterized protein
MAIRGFQGRDRFLSNFWGRDLERHARLAIVYEGLTFPTVEHAYVAAKLTDPVLRKIVRDLPTPGLAKRFLLMYGLAEREDWSEIKLGTMESLVRQKFSHPELAKMLLLTGDEELIEANAWGDTFWGVDHKTGEGQNHLGRILMKIRAELRAG